MPVTYRMAEPPVVVLVDAVLRSTFPHLAAAELVIDVMTAHAAVDKDGNPTGVAIKLHGVPCLATIKVRNLKDRVAGFGDVLLLLDGDRWPDLSKSQQEGLIDHELEHVVLKLDASGGVVLDDAGRPVVKLKQHDFDLGGFWATVERRKESAPESANHDEIARGFRQREFPWGLC